MVRINLPFRSVDHPVDIVSHDLANIKASYDLAIGLIRSVYDGLKSEILISTSLTEDELYIDPSQQHQHPNGWDSAFGFTIVSDTGVRQYAKLWSVRAIKENGVWKLVVSSVIGRYNYQSRRIASEEDMATEVLQMILIVERDSRILKPKPRKAKTT